MRFNFSFLAIFLNVLLLVEISHAIGKRSKLLVHGRSKLGLVPPPDMDEASRAAGDNLKYIFGQKFDHTDSSNTALWPQEYWLNNQWAKPDGPIFLMLGGEGPDSYGWVTREGLHFVDLGIKYNATLITLEHRYYGLSRPTSDQSVENLKWLSSRQSLADNAFFIRSMNAIYGWTNRPWITFGGSYSGAMSAWMRQQYPDLVTGAIASSGPVFAKLDFLEYMDVVQTSLRTYSQDCANNIRDGFIIMKNLMQTASGRANLTNTFNLCPPFGDNMPSTKDIINFYDTIMGNFQYVVQYSEDNAGVFADRFTIPVVCDLMNNNSRSTLVRLADVNNLVMSIFGGDCTYTIYNDFIQCMLDPSFDAPCANDRSWIWQTCTEFGYFQSTDMPDNIFGSDTVPLSFYVDMCTEVFGPQYTQGFVSNAVDNTNAFYGGRDNYKGTNVVLPNGSIDPWHALGILNDTQNSDAIAAFIIGTAHCADMYPPRAKDPPGLPLARAKIDENIGKWLKEAGDTTTTSTSTTTTTTTTTTTSTPTATTTTPITTTTTSPVTGTTTASIIITTTIPTTTSATTPSTSVTTSAGNGAAGSLAVVVLMLLAIIFA